MLNRAHRDPELEAKYFRQRCAAASSWTGLHPVRPRQSPLPVMAAAGALAGFLLVFGALMIG